MNCILPWRSAAAQTASGKCGSSAKRDGLSFCQAERDAMASLQDGDRHLACSPGGLMKSIPAQEPGSQSHPGSGRRFKALVHHPQFLLGCRVQDHKASDRVSPQHADDAEPAVLQGVQRDGFVRPRDRRMSPGIAIKGARLASPGIEDGHVEHQIQFIRAVQDELACRPQTDAPCRLLDRGLAEMLQGTAEMLVGDGAKMAVAVERFLTCAHAVSWSSAASWSRPSSPRHPGPWRQDRISPALARAQACGRGPLMPMQPAAPVKASLSATQAALIQWQ